MSYKVEKAGYEFRGYKLGEKVMYRGEETMIKAILYFLLNFETLAMFLSVGIVLIIIDYFLAKIN